MKKIPKLSEQKLKAFSALRKLTCEAVWPRRAVYFLLGSACQSCNVIGTCRYGLNSFSFGLTVELIEGNPAPTVDCNTSAH